MQLQNLEIDNFLRIGHARIQLGDSPIHLFAGMNEAGKTSLCDAIRFALTGEVGRVAKKTDYKHLIKDGAKQGRVCVALDSGRLERDIRSGRLTDTSDPCIIDPAVQVALDGYHFMEMPETARRELLYELLEVREDRELIQAKLLGRGCNQAHVGQILPMLRTGMEGAQAAAKRFASEARGAWKALTHETYGAQKAEGWTPPLHDIDETMIPNLKGKAVTAERKISEIHTQIEQLWAQQGRACPSCNTLLHEQCGQLRALTDPVEDQAALQTQIEALQEECTRWDKAWLDTQEQLNTLLELSCQNKRATGDKAQAAAYHRDVAEWCRIADALAPDGIPGEILSDRLKPLNDRLKASAQCLQAPQVQIMPDLSIRVEGRPYSLQSKSAKWRTQAMIAEAIAHQAQCGVLLLDEIDILDMHYRERLLIWAQDLITDYSTIILVGTLKALPELEYPFTTHWLEQGEIHEHERDATDGMPQPADD